MQRSTWYVPMIIGVVLLMSCDRAKHGAKEVLNEGGRVAGTAAREVLEGVTTGVEDTWSVQVELSDARKEQGLGLGKVQVETGEGGNDNVVVLYLTTTTMINDSLRVTAYDNDGAEMGRTMVRIHAPASSGGFYEAHFPKRTDLERKSRVTIE
jgi:hypothetical protein